jgi:hypothetical protein
MFSAILVIAFAAFILRPYKGMIQVTQQTTCCKKTTCEKHSGNPEKKDCGDSGCNMLSCAFCSFFMPMSAEIDFVIPPGAREEHLSFNDHRLYFISSDCWHPPKQASFYSA